MGITEFEILIIGSLALADIVLGTLAHVFYTHDNNSSLAINSLIKKIVIIIGVVLVDFLLHIDRFHIFDKDVIDMVGGLRSGYAAMLVAIMYYQLSSVMKHLQEITGIDFTKFYPGLASEMRKDDNKHDLS